VPGGTLGDHPYTDIVMHNRRVYSETADDLIRKIARLASHAERDRLADLLLREYNVFNRLDVPKLERLLTETYARLTSEAADRGWETGDRE
jgi:hypothetical protein